MDTNEVGVRFVLVLEFEFFAGFSGQDRGGWFAVTEMTETAAARYRCPAYSSAAAFALAFAFLPLPLPCPVLFRALSDGLTAGASIFVLGAGILAETF